VLRSLKSNSICFLIFVQFCTDILSYFVFIGNQVVVAEEDSLVVEEDILAWVAVVVAGVAVAAAAAAVDTVVVAEGESCC